MPIPATSLVLPEDGEAKQLMMFLHGILGRRANWRGIARRFVAARPSWGAVLVDLRAHGDSQGFAPPHTIMAAAEDLLSLDQEVPAPIVGALGHSFGGKVALRWAERARDARELWLIDSMPGPRSLLEAPGGVLEVIQTLEGLPGAFADREAFVASLQEAGHTPALANWLAMNLARNADGRRSFAVDLEVIRALLTDYARIDLWPLLEQLSPALSIHVVVGGRSSIFDSEAHRRLAALEKTHSNIHEHIIPGAGHWVQTDAPDALIELLVAAY